MYIIIPKKNEWVVAKNSEGDFIQIFWLTLTNQEFANLLNNGTAESIDWSGRCLYNGKIATRIFKIIFTIDEARKCNIIFKF